MQSNSKSLKFTYKTSTGTMFDLTIPNAYDFDPNDQDDLTTIRSAANNIKIANAIETGAGNLVSVESIAL